MSKLLTRDEFRNSVLKRDKNQCVMCRQLGYNNSAVDAHHILERRLFDDGGYYLDNGASVCSRCHLECEMTHFSVEQVREACEIAEKVIPSHLYEDEIYDKWGNNILPNGQRLKGELFYDESVQKILKEGGVLATFTNYVKYPRTHHLPWSLGMHDDDRMHETHHQWLNKQVVVTLKMDGENTTMYSDYIHARSIESKKHPTRSWVKNFWLSIAHEIPPGWRICGENLHGLHSIEYEQLPSFFLGFSLWDDRNKCLDWDTTIEFFRYFGIEPVPVLYRGLYNPDLIQDIKLDFNKDEGYVLRTVEGFSYREFRKYVGKFVRPNHIKTTKHWMHGQPVVYNKRREALDTSQTN